MCHFLSPYQIRRLMSLVDGAISVNEGYIETHNNFLRCLSEEELLNLDDFELNYSDCLEQDISFYRELKLCLERGLK